MSEHSKERIWKQHLLDTQLTDTKENFKIFLILSNGSGSMN